LVSPAPRPERSCGETAFSGSFRQGFWRLADPKISLASISSIFLGACAAAGDGPIHWGWLAATVLGILAIEVAKNGSGEIFDFDTGADPGVAPEDRSPFSGGKRVLVDRLLTRKQTVWISASAYLTGIAIGLSILFWREPAVLWLGVVGTACAFFYNAPPIKLSYRGLGEISVALCYGPVICLGTYLVQRGEAPTRILWLSVPLGLMIGAFLLINEFPDYNADRIAGKRNLVVRLGRRRASWWFPGTLGAALLLWALLPAVGLPRGTWLGGASIIPAASAARQLLSNPESTRHVIPAQARTLEAFVLLALGEGIGLLLFR